MQNNNYILLIEDNKSIRKAILWALETYQISILTADNGHEALKMLEQPHLPRLIFLDLMMPQMDGHAFRKTKNANPRLKPIPTIISSANIHLNQFETEPHEHLLAKPFDLEVLFSIIQTYFK